MTRANFPNNADLQAEEATIAEWLAAGGSPLAVAGLVPLDYKDRPAEQVTLSEGQNNGK
jgi:hypothetical protein